MWFYVHHQKQHLVPTHNHYLLNVVDFDEPGTPPHLNLLSPIYRDSNAAPFDYYLGGWNNQEAARHQLKLHQNEYFHSFTITYLKPNLSATKTNFEKPPTGDGARG